MSLPQKISASHIATLAAAAGYEYAALQAVVNVESSGYGFSSETGRIIIQFEPAWFKRLYAQWQQHAAGSVWLNNGVRPQAQEWKAFNDAFVISPSAAMMSTSIGLMQVMGFHYQRLGFKTVDEMWDHAKVNLVNHLIQGIRFIQSDYNLDKALKQKDWHLFACHYNGFGYQLMAKKLKQPPYNQRLEYSYKSAQRSAYK